MDRSKAIITTAITNLDLHDIARSACTFGVSDVFVVHPIAAQRELATRVRDHWVGGSGASRIPTREPAMRLLRIVDSLDAACEHLGGRGSIEVYATTACTEGRLPLRFQDAAPRMRQSSRSSLLLLGTGWGLASSVLDSADHILEAISGANPEGYNHLSVRAACAIMLDRLLSPTREL